MPDDSLRRAFSRRGASPLVDINTHTSAGENGAFLEHGARGPVQRSAMGDRPALMRFPALQHGE